MNVMSLMGLMILIGMTVSDSILIVEFTRHLRDDGMTRCCQAVVTAARVRLRPVLMTSLATIIGLLPMALKISTGSGGLRAARPRGPWGHERLPS